ncbi:MAG: sodium/glutamate symporter [Vicinamibacteria bacterium]
MIQLDLVNSVACAGGALLLGEAARRRARVLSRHAVPGPVVGGLLVAAGVTALRALGHPVAFDTSLQSPLMVAFFTAIGFGASLPLLRRGGPAVALLLAIATAVGAVQNLVGVGLARALGAPPLLGVIAGSLTLMGGPATGLAFAPLFEQAGVPGAATLAVASAMVGIVAGGIVGGPIGTWLVERQRRAPSRAGGAVDAEEAAAPAAADAAETAGGRGLVESLVVLLAAMAAGSWVSAGLARLGLTLPGYVGAMVAAAAIRNIDDWTGRRLPHRRLDELGSAALALFIAMALMTLKLWELASLAAPMAVILAAQVAVTAALSVWPTYRLMGRDYDAAVTASGFCGFMLGTTANAMANLGALTDRHGPAPRAYLVVPMVGAFFVDFTNALLVTACLSLLR